MRCPRFAVLSLWCSLAGLVAVSLEPASAPVAAITCTEPADLSLAEPRAETTTIEGHALVGVDAATGGRCEPFAPGAWRLVAPVACARVQELTPSARSDRAPPLA